MNFENNGNNEIMSESGYINSRGDSGSDNDAFAPVTEESGDFPKEAGKENAARPAPAKKKEARDDR